MNKRVVVIGGGGHVGLPLALILADSGFDSVALDISVDTVEKINVNVVKKTLK